MWRIGLTVGALALLGACGADNDFNRDTAIARVESEARLDRDAAVCIVDGVLAEGLSATDFLDDPDADPRFARVFERVATVCLL